LVTTKNTGTIFLSPALMAWHSFFFNLSMLLPCWSCGIDSFLETSTWYKSLNYSEFY
jgi:hypothetical protein